MSKLSFHARWITAAGFGLIGLVAIGGPAQAAPGDVSTLAGSGAAGFVNATGSAASFAGLRDLVADGAGNVYVSEEFPNHRVRKITPAGVVTTFVGSGSGISWADGTGTAANVAGAGPMAIDSAGNIYLETARRIRRITPGGIVTTIAGSSATGSVNGPGATATFDGPAGLAVNGAGDLFVSDSVAHLIRKISGGIVSTFAGDGTAATIDGAGTSASIKTPTGIVFDSSGNLFVAEGQGGAIRKIDPSGNVTTFAATGNFGFPTGITIDGADNLYVAARNTDLILRITPAGMVSSIAGLFFVQGYVDGPNSSATFHFPAALTVFGSTLYVADQSNFAVRRIDISGVIPPAGPTSTTTTISSSTTTTTTPATSTTTTPATSTTTTSAPAATTTSAATPSTSPATTTTLAQGATSTAKSIALVFPSIPPVTTTAAPLPQAPTSTVSLTISTAPSPTTTLTVAAILASSSVPPAPAPAFVQGEAIGTTPAYTGSSHTSLVLLGLLALALGALILAGRSGLRPRNNTRSNTRSNTRNNTRRDAR